MAADVGQEALGAAGAPSRPSPSLSRRALLRVADAPGFVLKVLWKSLVRSSIAEAELPRAA